MKITLSNLFDTDQIIKRFIDAKLEGFEDFVKGIAEMNDKLTMVLRSNISISDNIDCVEKTLTLIHDEKITIDNPDRLKQVRHIVTTKAIPFQNPVTSFAWAYNAKGSIDIKAQFLGAPNGAVSVTTIMYF